MDTEAGSVPHDAVSACQVVEHDVVFLLDFPCVQDKHLPKIDALKTDTIDTGGALGILHPDRRDTELRVQPLFQLGALDLSTDLHPSVRAALDDRGAKEPPKTLPCRSLTDGGKRLLNGELARPPGDPRKHSGYVSGRGLAMPLPSGSRERIRGAGGPDQPFLRLEVEALHLLSFGSETGLAMLSLRVVLPRDVPVRLAQIEEVLHVLSNTTRHRTLGWACEEKPEGRFTLLELVEGILSSAGCGSTPWNRLFTVTYAQLTAPPITDGAEDGLAMAALRLSRHYTGAYRPGPDHRAGSVIARPFDDIVHATSMEGAATLTVPATAFLRDAFAHRMRSCYLPLAVLAFHEHVRLLDMAQRAAGALAGAARVAVLGASGRSSTGTPGDIARLEALRWLVDGFLSFRLRYRLTVVSDITMHNQFYAALRAALQLEALTQKLSGDTADAARALQDSRTRVAAARGRVLHDAHLQRERGRAWILGLFAGLLTFLTSLAALKEVQEVLKHHVHGGPGWLFDLASPAALAAALGVVSGIVTARRHRDAHSHDEDEDEIGQELAVDLRGESVHVASEAPVAER